MYDDDGTLHGVEAVIDKDLASALLAEQLGADLLVIATDVDGVYTRLGVVRTSRSLGGSLPTSSPAWTYRPDRWGRRSRRHAASHATPATKPAIGSLTEIADIVEGTAGTRVRS